MKSILSSMFEGIKTPIKNAAITTIVITLLWFNFYRPALIWGGDSLSKILKSQLPMLEPGGIVDTINIFANIPYLFNMYSKHETLAVVWMNVYYFFLVVIWAAAAVDVFIKLLEKGVQINSDVAGISKYDTKTVHGSARFLNQNEYSKNYRQISKDNPIIRVDKILKNDIGGVPVATKGPYAWLNSGGHVLVIGKTGSGKTRRIVLPTIWTLGHNKQSMIISDPKGEIYKYTHVFLEQQGYNVHVLNFLNPIAKGSKTWNPFHVINRFIQEKDYNQANILIHFLANTILNVANQGQKGSDPFWDQAAEAYIKSALYAMCYDPNFALNEKTFYNLVKTLVTFQDAAADRAGSFSQSDPMYEWIARVERDTGVNMTEQYALIKSAGPSEKTLGSILATAWAKLDPVMNDILYIITKSSEIDFREFGEKPSVLYIILPDETRVFDFFVSILVDFAYAELVQEARKKDGALPVPVWFILDEFGNLPRINDIDKKYSVARSRRIHFLIILQAYSQLYNVYGQETAKTILSNITTTIYLGTTDLETAKSISESLGVTTVKTDSVSYSKERSKSASTTQRPLLTPDEVMRIRQPQDPGGPPEALIMEIGKLPMRSVLEDMSTWSKLTQVFSQSANEDIFVVGEQDKERIREAISSLPRRMPGQTSKASEFGNGDPYIPHPEEDEDTYVGGHFPMPDIPQTTMGTTIPPMPDDIALYIENKRIKISKEQLKKIELEIANLIPSENEDEFNYVIRLMKAIRRSISK